VDPRYFSFNPNTVSDAELAELGISKKVIKTWLNFRSKGGKFRHSSDVQKIWGLPDSVYQRLLPYINIPDLVSKNSGLPDDKSTKYFTNQPYNNKYNSSKSDNSVELNSADSAEICSLPGIGPGFFKRIKKYRELLGGFVKKEQLLEVFGFTPEMYSKIESQVYVDKSKLNKIDINKADFKQLIRHPYFEKNEINKILEYKRIQGKIVNIEDLVKDKMITREQCDKIAPYIGYE
jgi:DNA uptake protein ComE-like DNA-binding protein